MSTQYYGTVLEIEEVEKKFDLQRNLQATVSIARKQLNLLQCGKVLFCKQSSYICREINRTSSVVRIFFEITFFKLGDPCNVLSNFKFKYFVNLRPIGSIFYAERTRVQSLTLSV